MNQLIATILQTVLVVLAAPFITGLVRFFKARLQGRKGASPFLPYWTILTLFKKEMVIPEAASWVFRAVPFVVMGSSIMLASVLPLVFRGGSLAGLSDFLIVSGILILGSIFLVLGGLDPGSAFGGMGSSREMTIAALVEPAILMVFAAMSFVSGKFDIDGMISGQLVFSHPYLWLSVFAFFLITLAENARYPVDNPATHLELTMVHEAMILEYSGPYLAILEYASSIKMTVFAILIANFIFPSTVLHSAGIGIIPIAIAFAFALLKGIIFAGILAIVEMTIVKMRFYRMQEYLSIAFFIALSGMVFSIFTSYTNVTIGYHTLFSALSVLFVILLFGHARSQAMLRYYSFSSLAIAGIAFSLSMVFKEEKAHLLIFAAVTVLIKSILVPKVIGLAQRKYNDLVDPRSFLRPASSYFLAIIVLAVGFFIVKHSPIIGLVESDSLLYASIAVVSLGLMTMIIHRNIFSEIIGLLVIENGIAIFALVTVRSLPLFIELGVFLVTIVTALILSVLSLRIRELLGSADTEQLRNLTE